jgi:hypothetical protein
MIVDRTDLSGLRRLRFDLVAREDESVPGMIARGVAGHHLVRLGYVMKEAGAGRYAGLTQLADPTVLTRIAHVIRTDADHLVAQTGRRLVQPGDRRLQHFVDFDGLILPRSHLELRRRRISPLALLDADHHRQPWLMAVLPFCPITLERLVDSCPRCGFALGWVQTAGIATCEGCLTTIPPTSMPPLAEELAEDYKLFAGLLSLVPLERERSVSMMPERLRQLAPGEAARLAMRCGLDCDESGTKRVWQTRAARLPPERIAHTIARGIAILRSWPDGISAWAADRLAHATDEKECRRELKRRIRRIAWGDTGFSDQRGLLGEVFPNLEPPSKSPCSETFYTGREANRRLPGFRDHASEIRRLGIVPHRPAPDNGDAIVHLYAAPVIDAAAKRMADATSISSMMDQLQLPRYALEQLIEADVLRRHDDRLLAVILRRPMAVASTYDDFVRNLKACRSRRAQPIDALPLGHESRRLGGGQKPWSDIYQALLARRIPFWSDGSIGSDNLLVARGSLDEFLATTPRCIGERAPEMSTGDAAELLNVTPGRVRMLRSAGVLPHTMGPRARTTPRTDVEKLAAVYVSAAEMARRTRTSAEHVNDQLSSLGMQSYCGLWNRCEVLDALPLR